MTLDRRIILGAAALVTVLVAAYFIVNGEHPGDDLAAPAAGQTSAELMAAGPLGDVTLGRENAPVLIIEYASLTCSHCAAFHAQTFPKLKKDYIDTGKVRFIFREFPFDPVASAGFMIARCAGPERYYNFIDVLLERQAQWAFADSPMDELKKLARQGGFTDESFNSCLANQEIFDHIRDVQTRAREVHGVRSTPTFFINGEKVEGALGFEEFEAIVKKHLGEEP